MVRPKVKATSSRAAEGSAFGFGNASFGGFATFSSPFSYLTELPDTSKVSDPHIVVILKSLFKRDPTTKAKALEDFQNLLSPSTDNTIPVEDAVLDIWVAVYPRISIDSTRRVRILAQTVQGLISSTVGKNLARHMPKLAGPWLLGSYDTDKGVASVAQSSLAQVFSSEKLLAVRRAYQSQILETCIDIIEKETSKTLSDERVVSQEEATAKYDRIVAGALGLLGSLLINLDEADRKKEAEKYSVLLTDKKLWGLISSEDGSVRRGINQLLRTCLEQQDIEAVLNLATLSAAYVEKALQSDQNGTASDLIRTLAFLTSKLPTIWTQNWKGKKAPYVRLRAFLKAGSRGASITYWREVSNMLRLIPKEAFPTAAEDAQQLLDAYRQGITGKSELKTYLKPGTLGYLEAVPSVTSNISNDDDRLTVLSNTVFPIIESFVLFGPEAKWSIALDGGSHVISQALNIDGVPLIVRKEWKRITESLIERIKKSLPETSKDFYKASQDSVKESGLRWALAAKEIAGIASERVTVEANIVILLRESLQLCKARNGKPYGATVTVQVLLKYLNDLVWNDSECAKLLDVFIADVLPPLYISPSTTALSAILLSARERPYFEAAWSTCLENVVAADDYPTKTLAFTELLSIAKQSGNVSILENSAVDDLIGAQLGVAVSHDANWDSLAHVLAAVSDEKATNALSTMTSQLTLDNSEAKTTLHGLSMIGKSEPRLLEKFLASSNGKALLSSVLRLTEAHDDGVALAAADLNILLHKSSSGSQISGLSSNKNNRMSDVIRTGIATASPGSVSVDTLISQAHNILKIKDTATVNSLVPDTAIWRAELSKFLRVTPPAVIDAMQGIPGIVFAVDQVDVLRQELMEISRDAEGLSIPLRMALYSVKLFEVTTLPEVDHKTMVEIVELLLLTTILTNDNLSVNGCNDIWIGQGTLFDAEIVEYISTSQHLVSEWLSKSAEWWLEDKEDSAYIVIDKAMSQLFTSAADTSPTAYYSSKAYEYLVTELISKHGLSQRRSGETSATLANLRRSEQLLQTAAFVTGYRDFISNIPVTKSWYNALIADATGLKFSEQRTKSIRQLSFLNIFLATMDDEFIATAAHQRLVFLFRDTVAGLSATENDPALQSLMLSVLGKLCGPLESVYGEYWATIIAFIQNLWLKSTTLHAPSAQDATLNLLHESQRLYRALSRLTKSEECNEDLSEALTASLPELQRGLLNLLVLDNEYPDEFYQPLRIVRGFIANELSKSSTDLQFTPEALYPVINAQNEAIQTCAYELLHRKIPELQGQISLDVAIEKKAAQIPDELLSLILEAPQTNALESLDEIATQLTLKRYLYGWALVFDHFTNAVSRK
jgi:hypothetical protein